MAAQGGRVGKYTVFLIELQDEWPSKQPQHYCPDTPPLKY
jgi:hypothetical protein